MLAVLYVSEGTRSAILNNLRCTANNGSGSVLGHSFVDAVYGRTSFFLLGDEVVSQALSLCNEAFSLIDYRQTEGSHPSLGVVDHVSFKNEY